MGEDGEKMKLYKLELLKRLSQGGNLTEDMNDQNHYIVFGHYDYLKVNQVKKFDELFIYDSGEKIKKQVFSKSTLFIYKIGNENTKAIFECAEDKQKSFALVSCLKLSTGNPMLREYKSSDELFSEIGKTVKGFICKLGAKYQNYKIDIFACLGSFDVIITIAGQDLGVLELSPIIHDITSSGMPIFQNSNSFLIVNRDYEYEKEDQRVQTLIRYSLRKIFKAEGIREFFEKNLLYGNAESNHPVELKLTYGEHDANLTMVSCSLHKLLYIMGVKNESFNRTYGKDLVEKLKKYEIMVRDDIRYIYTRLHIEDTDELKEALAMIQSSTEESSGYGQKECCMEEETNIEKLLVLKDQLQNVIPYSAKRTLNLLISQCVLFLTADNRLTTGKRFYNLLTTILSTIRDYHVNINPDEILYCLGCLSSTMETAIQSDNIELNYIDGDDVESINSITKLLYAYENILRKTSNYFQTESESNDNLIFIAMDSKQRINSVNYFAEANLKRTRNDYKHIISVHLPNAHYFNPKYSMPYLIHEIGHYMKITGTQNESRNKAIHNYCILYAKCYVMDYIMKHPSHEQSLDVYSTLFDDYCDLVKEKFTFRKNLNPKLFKKECVRFIIELYSVLKYICEDKKDECHIQTMLDLKEAFESLVENMDFINMIVIIIREARADMIMISICGMDVIDYIRTQFEFMRDNLIDNYYDDISYYLRTASVVQAFCDMNRLLVSDIEQNLTKTLDDFSTKIFDVMKTQYDFVGCVSDYLCNLSEELNKNEKTKEDKYQNTNLERFYKNFSASPIEYVKFYMDEWYENLIYLLEE